jgi:hypothetical protein
MLKRARAVNIKMQVIHSFSKKSWGTHRVIPSSLAFVGMPHRYFFPNSH